MDLIEQISSNLSTKKISITEFAESDLFCGKRLYPRQRLLLKLIFLEELSGYEEDVLDYWIAGGRSGTEVTISPLIRERIQYLRDNRYPHFREVVLSGGRRSSKGFVSGIAMAKLMYDTIMLQDPGAYYQIDPEKEIYFSCIASAEIQAKKFQYADLVSTIETCVALEPHMGKSLETEFGLMTAADHRKVGAMKARGMRVQKQVARIRGNALASNASTLRGSATMGLIIDEMAHMIPGESRASADLVYDAAVPSLDQFGVDALIMCNSSPYTKVGKFFERYREAMRENEKDPTVPAAPLMMAFRFPSWALFDGYQDDPERRFRKAITVSADWDPEEKKEDGKFKWAAIDRQQISIAREDERQEPEKYKVERRANFAEVIDAYLNPAMIDIMFMGRPKEDTHEGFKVNWADSTYRYKYVAHCDPSSTTAGFGFALGHLETLVNKKGVPGEHVVFDIIKRWDPKSFAGGVIDWEEVINEIIIHCDIFRPAEISFDQFQSAAPIQQLRRELRERNITTRVHEKVASAESNWNRAEVFRTILYQELVHAPNDTADTELSALELKFLQQKNTGTKFPKVDRQTVGPVQTKDMADSIMTVAEVLLGNIVARETRDDLTNMRMAHGAPGGYKIGGEVSDGHPLAGYYSKRQGEQSGSLGPTPKSGARRAWGNKPAQRKLPGW